MCSRYTSCAWLGLLVSALERRLSASVFTVIAHAPGDNNNPMLAFRHSINFVPRVACPILLVSGLRDKLMRVEFAKGIFPLFKCEKQELGYDLPHYISPKEYNIEILEWLDQKLK